MGVPAGGVIFTAARPSLSSAAGSKAAAASIRTADARRDIRTLYTLATGPLPSQRKWSRFPATVLRAAVGLDDVLHQREAETSAPNASRFGVVQPGERSEGDGLGGNADAAVANRADHRTLPEFSADGDRASARGRVM